MSIAELAEGGTTLAEVLVPLVALIALLLFYAIRNDDGGLQ